MRTKKTGTPKQAVSAATQIAQHFSELAALFAALASAAPTQAATAAPAAKAGKGTKRPRRSIEVRAEAERVKLLMKLAKRKLGINARGRVTAEDQARLKAWLKENGDMKLANVRRATAMMK